MIKPITTTNPNKQVTLNLMSCASPVVYESTKNYKPLGQNLNIECDCCRGRRRLGNKLNVLA